MLTNTNRVVSAGPLEIWSHGFSAKVGDPSTVLESAGAQRPIHVWGLAGGESGPTASVRTASLDAEAWLEAHKLGE